MRYTHKQHFAYYLAKNFIFDAISNKKLVLASEHRDHFVGELEKKVLEFPVTLDNELSAIADSGIQIVFIGEKGYPKALENLEDAPVMLFVKSKTDAEELFNAPGKEFVTITGTRDASLYGLEMTEKVINEFLSPVIVSGLAIGIDFKTHETTLEKGIPTIAVLPSSIDEVYPKRHLNLAEKIAKTEGCALVSPFVPGTAPEAINFIFRNHILAGLSDTTVVVESRLKGGAIVTARVAHSYGRTVYAVPGRIGDIRSEGCNALIKEEIAKLW